VSTHEVSVDVAAMLHGFTVIDRDQLSGRSERLLMQFTFRDRATVSPELDVLANRSLYALDALAHRNLHF
jgi:hypothetical protein